MYVTRARLAAVLSTLRANQLIEMRTMEKDRRKMEVFLTSKGRAYIVERTDQIERYFNALYETMGDENMKELIRLIHLSLDAVQTIK